VSRLLGVVLLTATYLLVLGSADPWDVATGLLLATVLTLAVHRRPAYPAGSGGPLLPRLAAFPALAGATLVDILHGTWDVGLRVLRLRPLDAPGIVLVPIGDRTPLGVAVNGLLVGLSPGSVLLEVDRERGLMLFHVVDAGDPDGVRARIEHAYQRYQRRVWP
jgi:multicomponent Na+:H+ antiporter subunit E